MALLTRIVGPLPALAGFLVSGALVPLSAVVGRALAAVRRKVMHATDRRVQLTSEVITGTMLRALIWGFRSKDFSSLLHYVVCTAFRMWGSHMQDNEGPTGSPSLTWFHRTEHISFNLRTYGLRNLPALRG